MDNKCRQRWLLSPEDLDYIRSRYQRRIAEKGLTFDSMNSGTREKQRLRHQVHAEAVRPGQSVLDVGCGLGDFCRFLQERGFSGQYTGTDIVPEYIEHCRQNFPDGTFVLADALSGGFPGEFDTIVASQVFNARYPTADNRAVVQSFLADAFAHARHAVSIDLLTSYVDYHEDYLYNYAPEEMFTFAKGLTRLVSLRHDYLPFEFALQLFRAP
jgi:SAM-dependent methyltransferase